MTVILQCRCFHWLLYMFEKWATSFFYFVLFLRALVYWGWQANNNLLKGHWSLLDTPDPSPISSISLHRVTFIGSSPYAQSSCLHLISSSLNWAWWTTLLFTAPSSTGSLKHAAWGRRETDTVQGSRSEGRKEGVRDRRGFISLLLLWWSIWSLICHPNAAAWLSVVTGTSHSAPEGN